MKPKGRFQPGETPPIEEFMRGGCYVVIAENSKSHRMPSGREFFDDLGPLVFEWYLQHSDLENARRQARRMAKSYGPTRIARLHFLEEEIFE